MTKSRKCRAVRALSLVFALTVTNAASNLALANEVPDALVRVHGAAQVDGRGNYSDSGLTAPSDGNFSSAMREEIGQGSSASLAYFLWKDNVQIQVGALTEVFQGHYISRSSAFASGFMNFWFMIAGPTGDFVPIKFEFLDHFASNYTAAQQATTLVPQPVASRSLQVSNNSGYVWDSSVYDFCGQYASPYGGCVDATVYTPVVRAFQTNTLYHAFWNVEVRASIDTWPIQTPAGLMAETGLGSTFSMALELAGRSAADYTLEISPNLGSKLNAPVSLTPVPEPSVTVLLNGGLLLLAMRVRNQCKSRKSSRTGASFLRESRAVLRGQCKPS